MMLRSVIVTSFGEHEVSPKTDRLIKAAPKNRFGAVDGRTRAGRVLRRYERMVCAMHHREWLEDK